MSFAPVGDGLFEPRPIEDMHPVLERQELSDLMVVPQLDFSLPRPDGREIDMMRRYPKSRRPIDIRPLAKATGSAVDEDYNPLNESLFEQLAANKYEQLASSTLMARDMRDMATLTIRNTGRRRRSGRRIQPYQRV